ncbi:MAG TPA: DUF1254 domain-containing protein, partial [Marmoricola sp.]|nr:DUF1254 domain-containing protein [Marmoricola sp.]
MKFRFAMPALALVAGLLSLTPAHADTTSADYKTGYNLGHLAFEYGIPLMDMQRVYATQTSINVSDSSGDGPVNQFSSVPHLIVPTPSQKTVVAPNADTLYSIAWLDLSKQAQVIHVPAIKGRFYSVSLYTPWTENFFNITSLAGTDKFGAYRVTSGGNFVVTPPGFRGKVPTGVRRIASPYKRVWIIVRTLIRGKEDTAAVNKIQRGYGLKPLSAYGHPFTAPRPRRPVTALRYATVPGTQPGQDPLAFYVALNRELIRFAPMSQDGPLLAQLKQIDVGPGLNPANDSHLSADMLAGMRAAVTDGPANIQSELKNLFLTTGSAHNWYFVVRTGTYGTDYQRRAIVDVKGLGAPRSNISVYPFTQNNLVVAPLSGSSSYVLHIPAGQLPPVQAF